MSTYRRRTVILLTVLVYIYLNIVLFTGSLVFSEFSDSALPFFRFLICCVCVWLLHFVCIDIQNLRLRGRYTLIAGLYVFWSVLWYVWWVRIDVYILLGIFHLGVLFMLIHKRHIFHEYRYISTWKLTTYGVRNTLVCITLVISCMLAFARQSYTLQCDQLYAWWDRISHILLWEQVSEMDVDTFKQATIWDMFGIQQQDLTKLVSDIALLEKTQKLTEKGSQDTIFSSLGTWKDKLLDELSNDKNIINEWFCALVIDQIDSKKDSQWFIYSTTILLFFIFYPLVKICSLMVSFVCFILLRLFELLGIYVREEETGIVESIR